MTTPTPPGRPAAADQPADQRAKGTALAQTSATGVRRAGMAAMAAWHHPAAAAA